MEACFYECDHNIGRYRKYPTCVDANGEQNAWEISGMPLSSVMADAWFTACADDWFCTGDSGSYFDLPTLQCAMGTSTCRKFRDIYTNSTNMVNKLWAGSFSYGGPNDFVFPSPGAAPFDNVQYVNPNNAVQAQLPDPPFCPFRTSVSGWEQAVSDIQLYAANMLKYTNVSFAGVLYAASATINNWWVPPPASVPTPPPACTSGAARVTVAAVSLAAAAAVALLA